MGNYLFLLSRVQSKSTTNSVCTVGTKSGRVFKDPKGCGLVTVTGFPSRVRVSGSLPGPPLPNPPPTPLALRRREGDGVPPRVPGPLPGPPPLVGWESATWGDLMGSSNVIYLRALGYGRGETEMSEAAAKRSTSETSVTEEASARKEV